MRVGDYVETCHLLPAILQKIAGDDVEVYHYEYSKYKHYFGGSCCSIKHCGVHTISKERYDLLIAIGHEKLKELWYNGYKDYKTWEDVTENYYKENINT